MPLPPNDAGMPQAIACVFLFPEEEKVDFPFVVDGKDIGHDIKERGTVMDDYTTTPPN
jgi:hypothetical protein